MTPNGDRRRQPAANTPRPPGKQTHRQYTPILDLRGVMVAALWGGTLRKIVHGSRHLLRRPVPSWAVDLHALAEAKRLGAVLAEVRDLDSGLTYSAPVSEFDRHGLPLDRGAGPQVALPLGYWSIGGRPPVLGPPEASPEQLALWGDAA